MTSTLLPTSRRSAWSAPRDRLARGPIDAPIVAGIDILCSDLTLRLCGLCFAEAYALPIVPFKGFLLLLNGGYLAAFTAANGQNDRKMAAGIKVIGALPGEAGTPDGPAAAGVRFALSRISPRRCRRACTVYRRRTAAAPRSPGRDARSSA